MIRLLSLSEVLGPFGTNEEELVSLYEIKSNGSIS